MFKSILEILKVFIELEFFEEGRDMGEKEGARVWRGLLWRGWHGSSIGRGAGLRQDASLFLRKVSEKG